MEEELHRCKTKCLPHSMNLSFTSSTPHFLRLKILKVEDSSKSFLEPPAAAQI